MASGITSFIKNYGRYRLLLVVSLFSSSCSLHLHVLLARVICLDFWNNRAERTRDT